MFVVDSNSDVLRVSHPEATAERGFDLTDFGTAAEFQEIIDGFNLQGDAVTRDGRTLFIWHSDNLMMVTGNNPITGEHSFDSRRPPEEGYASKIGIEGRAAHVETLSELIKERAFTDGATGVERREFI